MELGRYRILSQLGQGGMATVYLGEDPLLNRLVAIKVIQAHLTNNPGLLERFTVEAKTIASLRHVNIVEIFDFGFQDNQQYLVMEYIDGQNLQMLCAAMAGMPMPDDIAASIICQAAEGLTSAEKQGVVHRDIKPENLLFNSEGVLKIADFGIAHIADEQSRTQTGAVLGSPNFMSPEQIEGVKPTHFADLFSLGGVLYYCLTGKLPFTGPSIPVTLRNICDRPHPPVLEINPAADPELVRIVDVLLQKDPAARGEGARSLANHLRGYLGQRGIVDIVDHCRLFISGLSIPQNQTIVEATPTRPRTGAGTGGMSGASLMRPALPGSGSGIGTGLPGPTYPYSPQPTTGTLAPPSRSPIIWIGAMLTLAILILAGAVYWSRFQPQPTPTSARQATTPPPKAVAVAASPKKVDVQPLTLEPAAPAREMARPVVTRPAAPKAPKAPKTQVTPKAPTPTAVRPVQREVVSPPPEPAKPQTGEIKIKSAPPFASLTINGKNQGETPMNSWLEVPVGKVHIEIVHRLTPPFDTVIQITPGFKREFKFKLDR